MRFHHRFHRPLSPFDLSYRDTSSGKQYGTPLRFALVGFIVALLLSGALALTTRSASAQQPSPEFDINEVTVPQQQPAAVFGEQLYAENCAPCHGQAGMGDGPVAADSPDVPTAFADPDVVWQNSPAELFHTTKFGRIQNTMPPWRNQMTDREIWDTVAFAWSLHTSQVDIADGEAIYQESCAACHGESGAGDGPDASGDINDFTDMTKTMAQSAETWMNGWQDAHPEVGADLTQDEQRAVLNYIRTFTMLSPWQEIDLSGDGAINGTIVTGEGIELQADTVVTLDAFLNFQQTSQFTTTADSEGAFSFTNLALDPSNGQGELVYIASLFSDGVRYASPFMMLTADQPTQEATISVFAASDDDSGIVLNRVHWIVDSQPGALIVLQVLDISNNAATTFAGKEVDGLDVPATIAMHIPEDAVELSFESGELGDRFRRVGPMVYDTAPVQPGQSTRQIVLQYALLYDQDSASLEQTFEYPAELVNLRVADLPDLEVDVQGLEPKGTEEIQGQQFMVWEASNMDGETLNVSFGNLMQSGDIDPRATQSNTGTVSTQASVPLESWMAWIIGIAAMLGIAVVAGFSWQRGLLQNEANPLSVQEQRADLIRRVARLDDMHALGEVSDTEWHSQRAMLKRRILDIDEELMAGSGSGKEPG